MKLVYLLTVLLLVVGCGDKAKPGFENCEALEREGRLEMAVAICQGASSMSPDSIYGVKAMRKSFELQRKIDDFLPPVVTAEWCSRLTPRLLPRLADGARAASPTMNGAYVEASVRQHLENMEYNCRRDIGKSTDGEWACRWNETFENAKECDKLRAR